jgi:N-acetylneuraminic acid mutarotase
MKKVFACTLISILALCAIAFESAFLTSSLPVKAAAGSAASTILIVIEPNVTATNCAVTITISIRPLPPSHEDIFHGVTLRIEKPDGGFNVYNPLPDYFTNETGEIVLNPNRTLSWTYVPKQTGTFTLQASYPGETFSGGSVTYAPSESSTIALVVNPADPANRTTPLLAPENVSGNYWTEKASMHVARSSLGVASVNNKIYAIGGSTQRGKEIYTGGTIESSGGVVNTNEEYDPTLDAWTTRTSMPTARSSFAIATCNDKIYCIGGYTDKGSTAVNEVYNPKTDKWAFKSLIPICSGDLHAHSIEGKIYVMDPSGTNYVYDPITDSWSTKTPMPTTAGGTVSAITDNKIYVVGRSTPTQIYDPETDNWTSSTVPPSAFKFGASEATTGIMAPKLVYVMGKPTIESGGNPLYSNQAYNPRNGTWIVGAEMLLIREKAAIAVINDTLYVIGGQTRDGGIIESFEPSSENQQYTPIGYGTPDYQDSHPSYSPDNASTPTVNEYPTNSSLPMSPESSLLQSSPLSQPEPINFGITLAVGAIATVITVSAIASARWLLKARKEINADSKMKQELVEKLKALV